MSDVLTANTSPIVGHAANPPALTARTKAERKRVTGRLKVAIDAIVWDGLPWNEAAVKANLTVRTMRLALERPHVIAYLKAQKQVFRASVSGQNIHVLAELRDASGNAMARLGAIKVLEQIDDERVVSAQQSAPGVVIVIGSAHATCTPIASKPLISLSPVITRDIDEA